MEFSKKKMKKAPLPWALSPFASLAFESTSLSEQAKLLAIIRNAFNRMFAKRDRDLSSSERKEWGNFLLDRGMLWEVTLPSRLGNSAWEGWEVCDRDPTRVRPKGLENHVRVYRYYLPKELAMRMLVLGDLI